MSKIDTSPAALRALADNWAALIDSTNPTLAGQAEYFTQLFTALADEKESQAAPAGWKLVPVSLTNDMLRAARVNLAYGECSTEQVWASILAAAPQPNGHCPVLTAEREEAGRNVQTFVDSQGGIGERPMIPAWLPIDTAPVDEEIDLWAEGQRIADCIYLLSGSEPGCVARWKYWGVNTWGDGDWIEVKNPTHWMRAPKGPKT